MNAIITCLKDENPLVKRLALDLLIHKLNLTHPIYRHTDKISIVFEALSLMIKKDQSITRRINLWLFGKPDADNRH